MKLRIAPLSIAVVIVASTAFLTQINRNSDNHSVRSDYMNFTVSYTVETDDTNDNVEMRATVYEYNFETAQIEKIFDYPLNSMYSLGVYDKENQLVYYTKEKDNDTYVRQRTGDEIYAHDLTTGTDQQLTEGLLAVNYITPVDNAVFFIAALETNPDCLVLGKIDRHTDQITYWDMGHSVSANTFAVDTSDKRIYVSAYDATEMENAIDGGNGFIPPECAIYSFDYDLRDKKQVVRYDKKVIKALYASDGMIMYRTDDTISPLASTVSKTEIINLSDDAALAQCDEIIPVQGDLSPDHQGFYALTEMGDTNGISFYEFETQTYTPVIKCEFGSIANFQLMQ